MNYQQSKVYIYQKEDGKTIEIKAKSVAEADKVLISEYNEDPYLFTIKVKYS